MNNENMVSVPRELLERSVKIYSGRPSWDALEPDRLKAAEEIHALLAQPAAQHQGEPVAWRGINELGEVVTDWIDGIPPSSMVNLCGNPDSFARIEQAYTHADPAEVERLRVALGNTQALLDQANYHKAQRGLDIDALRAQLAKRDALLARVVNSGALSSEKLEELETDCCAAVDVVQQIKRLAFRDHLAKCAASAEPEVKP